MERTDFGIGVAGHAPSSATTATLDLDQLADELHFASQNLRRARSAPPAGVYRLSECPAPLPEQDAALSRVVGIGRRLFDRGGDDLMLRVYDRAVELYDYPGVFGVGPAWNGIGAWVN